MDKEWHILIEMMHDSIMYGMHAWVGSIGLQPLKSGMCLKHMRFEGIINMEK